MNQLPHRIGRLRQTGSVIVEFALILTLLVSIIAAIVGFGRTFWYYDALSKATRNAARAVSVSNPATIASVAVDAARAVVNDAAADAGVPGFKTDYVIVTCLDASMNTATCTDGVAPAGVRVMVDYYPVTLGSSIPFLLGTNRTYTVNLAPATTMPYMR